MARRAGTPAARPPAFVPVSVANRDLNGFKFFMKEYPNFHLHGSLDPADFTCVVFNHPEFQKVPEIIGLGDFSPIILQEFFHSFC